MNIMSKKEWASFSDDEKVHHLLDYDVEYRKEPLVNLKAERDEDVISWKYQAVIGGVVMSTWHATKQWAADEALLNTANFVAQINYQNI